jgi:hypothetical protein
MLLSFMSESRRLSNQRMKAELGVQLCFPSVKEGLMHIVQATADSAQNHLYEAATS